MVQVFQKFGSKVLAIGALVFAGATAGFAAPPTLSSTPPAGGPNNYVLHATCTTTSTPKPIVLKQRRLTPPGPVTTLSTGTGTCPNGGSGFAFPLDTTGYAPGIYRVWGIFNGMTSNPLIFIHP
jgi:hypothetical protein